MKIALTTWVNVEAINQIQLTLHIMPLTCSSEINVWKPTTKSYPFIIKLLSQVKVFFALDENKTKFFFFSML